MLRHTQTPASPPPPRLYYGWYIVGACNLVACITWGMGIFNQGVFLGYFASHYGWSRATLSIGPMLFHFWAGLAGVVVGRSIDRHGPRPVLLLGACLMGAGALAFGLTRHPWHTYPAFVLPSTGFACLHTVTLGKIVARWFVLQPLATASCFGQRVFGRIYGPIYLGIRPGAAFGPLFIGVISTALGRYQPAWLLLAVALLLALAFNEPTDGHVKYRCQQQSKLNPSRQPRYMHYPFRFQSLSGWMLSSDGAKCWQSINANQEEQHFQR